MCDLDTSLVVGGIHVYIWDELRWKKYRW